MRIRRFLHLILGVAALCLVWQIVTTWNRTPPIAHSAPGRGGEEDGALISLPTRPAQVGAGLAKQITDKDLFSPERQRPEVVSESPPAEVIPPPSHLTLVGVFLAPGREEAFLADSSQANKVTRVQKGKQIGQYLLAKVTSTEVTLSLGPDAGEVNLSLRLLDSQGAKKAPRVLPEKSRAGQTNRKQASRKPKKSGPDDTVQIRQQIQQMQRRLRKIRRQAARENRIGPDGRPVGR